jgi:hypothetical protein
MDTKFVMWYFGDISQYFVKIVRKGQPYSYITEYKNGSYIFFVFLNSCCKPIIHISTRLANNFLTKEILVHFFLKKEEIEKFTSEC